MIDDELRELGRNERLPELPDVEFVMMYDARKATAVEFAETIFGEVEARMGPGKRNPGCTDKGVS